jgi:hypothetical protein
MQRMNIIVQLRNQLIECSLLGFHGALLGRLDSGDDGCELTDLDDTLIEVVLVLLLDLELELSQSIVDLPVEVDLITNVLEMLVNVIEVPSLLNELVNVFDLLREV